MINNVVLVGRLTKDVELKQTQSGLAVARFTLAVNRPFGKKENGEQQADFIQIQVWRKQAENCAQYLRKGSLAGITGRIQTGSYDGQDGKRVYTTEVVADNVQFLEPKSSTNSGANQQNATGNQYGGQQGFQQQQGMYQQPSYQNSGVNNDPFAGGQNQNGGTINEDSLPF